MVNLTTSCSLSASLMWTLMESSWCRSTRCAADASQSCENGMDRGAADLLVPVGHGGAGEIYGRPPKEEMPSKKHFSDAGPRLPAAGRRAGRAVALREASGQVRGSLVAGATQAWRQCTDNKLENTHVLTPQSPENKNNLMDCILQRDCGCAPHQRGPAVPGRGGGVRCVQRLDQRDGLVRHAAAARRSHTLTGPSSRCTPTPPCPTLSLRGCACCSAAGPLPHRAGCWPCGGVCHGIPA